VKQIRNLIDLAHHVGTSSIPEQIGRKLNTYTDCGPWTMFYFPDKVKLHYLDPLPPDLNLLSCEAVKLGASVEGVGAELETDLLMFPFTGDEFDREVIDLDIKASEERAEWERKEARGEDA
jgi:hypothetical protein